MNKRDVNVEFLDESQGEARDFGDGADDHDGEEFGNIKNPGAKKSIVDANMLAGSQHADPRSLL